MIQKTNRLLLRPWHEEDAEDLYTYAKDPDVALPAGWPPHVSVAHSREIIRTILHKPTVWAICRADNVPVGNIHLDPDTPLREDNSTCELGFWLGKPFWGQGFVPEAAEAILRLAFAEYGMQTVLCGYYDGNAQSRRVQEKLGFVRFRTDTVQTAGSPPQIRAVHRTKMSRDMWEKRYGNI